MKRLICLVAVVAIAAGLLALLSAAPAMADPPTRCTIETGDPGCPPCTHWDSHRCACVHTAGCKS